MLNDFVVVLAFVHTQRMRWLLTLFRAGGGCKARPGRHVSQSMPVPSQPQTIWTVPYSFSPETHSHEKWRDSCPLQLSRNGMLRNPSRPLIQRDQEAPCWIQTRGRIWTHGAGWSPAQASRQAGTVPQTPSRRSLRGVLSKLGTLLAGAFLPGEHVE